MPLNQQLYEEHYRPYPNVVAPITRGTSETSNFQLMQAFLAYQKQQYKEAENLFKALYAENGQPTILFYVVMCQMEQGDIKMALVTLQENEWPEAPFNMKQDAKWYQALCYLAEGKMELARVQLGLAN
jgi:hypothetical protein